MDGDSGEAVAAHDGLERQFHRDVEMRGEDRAHALDHLLTVDLEGIRRVVQPMAEKKAHEEICQAIDEKFDPRVVDHAPATHEAAAEHAVRAFAKSSRDIIFQCEFPPPQHRHGDPFLGRFATYIHPGDLKI